MGLLVLTAEFDQRYRVLRNRLNITDILIDALLGTGVTRPIEGELAKLMGHVKSSIKKRNDRQFANNDSSLTTIAEIGVNRSENGEELTSRPISNLDGLLVAAVDCPSGLNCDNGQLDELAFPAHLTITFAGPKRGHFIFPGAAACGELIVADIGIGPELDEVADVQLELVTQHRIRQLLPARPIDGHKGTFGWVMIAAGSSRYWGAPALAGKAAYRTGSGLVALAVPSVVRPAVATMLPEATYPLVEGSDTLGVGAAQRIIDLLPSYQSLLLGPGLHEAEAFIEVMLSNFAVSSDNLPPLVIDADGLNLLSRLPDWPDDLPSNSILTPHPGELARLMGVGLAQVKDRDRIELALELAEKWGCVLLFKGAFTVIAAPDGRCAILPFANPALATAGSGDVLSGIVAALLGQGLDSYEAAITGGFLHGAAAELAGVSSGLLAGEIADWVPEVIKSLS
jgi:NAD(P)H-hydrate epimerase